MRINYIIYLLLSCFFFSCKGKIEVGCLPITSIDLSGADTLLLEQVSTEGYLLSYPEAMILLNGQLVIQDKKGQSSLFHAIDVKDGQISEFVFRGNGPEEYLDVNLNPFVCGNNMVGFYDGIKRKVFFWEQINNQFRFFKMWILIVRTNGFEKRFAVGTISCLQVRMGVFQSLVF